MSATAPFHPFSPVTYLFVPGNRPERFDKALASGADRVILDLEDAVAPGDKGGARSAIAAWLEQSAASRARILVRINDASTNWHVEDLNLLRQIQPCAVMLPKCEDEHQIAAVHSCLTPSATLVALIESARGIEALPRIAGAPGVSRLAFGALDYMVDLDIPAHSPALAHAAVQIAVASRAAGLAKPIAGVTPDMDTARVASDMQDAMNLGFGAKMCIHPMQVAAVRQIITPTEQEVAWAQRILLAWNAGAGGVLQVDGKMVDRPVVLKAERIISRTTQTFNP
jgi:citrate lyase subunit beta / citryl-CoA lyase